MREPARHAALAAPIALLLVAACGGTVKIEEDPYYRPPDTTARAQTQATQFEASTDTVASLPGRAPADSLRAGDAGVTAHYTIQIGAYKDPRNASATQARARERYNVPVLNEFDPKRGLYQIRLGLFEAREAAEAFLAAMKTEHPGEYRDAWIAVLKP